MKNILALIFLLISFSIVAEETSFDSAKNKAQALHDISEFKEFLDTTLQSEFMNSAACALRSFFKAVEHPDTTPYEMIFEVEATGGLVKVHLRPETNIGRCMAIKLCETQFSQYGEKRYYFHEKMSFTK